MTAVLALAVLFAPTVPLQQSSPPTAEELIQQGRSFLPAYDGDKREFLTEEEQRQVRAAASILDASLALDDGSAFALWWKGHAEVLLGEDRRNRGQEEVARVHYGRALAAFERGIELDPGYYWAYYARAMALNDLGQPWAAIADYDEAVRVANERIAAAADDQASLDPRFVRFKARQWRADTRMRVLEFDLAREEFRSFYADNGNNQWDLGYSLAETYLRQRDFAGARRTWEELLPIEDFGTFDTTYAQMAYVAGLLGDPETATRRLEEALERELSPGLYLRLWLWVLSAGEERTEARRGLVDFLAHPPADLSAWDVTLGGFLTGDASPDEFLQAAAAEEELRKREARPLDDLPCEAWFYVGLRHEEDAASAADEGMQGEHRAAALDAYQRSVRYTTRTSKWEWEYARQRLAALAAELGAGPVLGFALEGERLVPDEGAPAGRVEIVYVHRPGEESAHGGLAALRERPLEPGDHVQCVVRRDDGTPARWSHVVDARLP